MNARMAAALEPTNYKGTDPQPTGSLSFNIRNPQNDDRNDIFNPPSNFVQFNTQIQAANDFGFSFVDLTHSNGTCSFDILIHFYNNPPPNDPVQGNKGSFIVPPFATWRLTLTDFLDGTPEILMERTAGDMVKDLVHAKTGLSMNGSKEVLRRALKNVFPPTVLSKTLDQLFNQFKYDLALSSGETIITGVLSHGNHNFRIPNSERAGYKIVYRDSGPKPENVDTRINNQELNVDIIKNSLTSAPSDDTTIAQYTSAQHKDPATNNRSGAFYSPLFSNYYSNFLSKFYGVMGIQQNNNLSMALFTRRINNDRPNRPNRSFFLDIEIINRTGTYGQTLAEYNNVKCNMTQNGMAGFERVPDQTHRYTYLDKGPRSFNSGTHTEFFKNISGNVSKNKFFLKFMNKAFTDTKEAEGMAKLILKAGGDADQPLHILQEILYYSLLIYRDGVMPQQQQQPPKTFHQIFYETLNKYLLITCDSVLSGLARRLQFPHVIQIGNSINYIKYGTTSNEEKAVSTFLSLKEKLKKDLENYMKLLSRCKIGTLYIVFGDDEILPVTSKTGGREPFCDLNENIKLLMIAIQKHFTTIEDLQPVPVTSLDIAELIRISESYKVSIITKTTKITPEKEIMTIYHLNYLQSLSLLLSLGIDMEGFVFCYKNY